ncbi:hypothetical protein [Fibrella aquatilis]|uniref:Uncharacterized protein n=1 Tax=Fibrella aquatilis TaxID=2817059 RepID=A0A939JZG5_9BACT|nr:hypothetical protein [Fibrella aquatilis]MBO0930160.1 hypothetical protein [Fibrella aquatilis]
MDKKLEESLKLDLKRKVAHTGLRMLVFSRDGQSIVFLPSLNLTAYGDSESEATDMLQIVLKDYFDNLFALTEQQAMQELKQYGWIRKPFLAKQLRNVQFLDVETIKQNFELPAETQIREEYMTA